MDYGTLSEDSVDYPDFAIAVAEAVAKGKLDYGILLCNSGQGMLMAAKALLDRNNNPSDPKIREALAGNLCRCGTYPQHPKAVLEAARVMREAQ